MDKSPSTRGPVSPVTSHNATTPRITNQLQNLELEKMASKTKPPHLTGDRQLQQLVLGEDDSLHETDLYVQMQKEKDRYPGASGWAPAEERLFEILFTRQDLPMLPSNWDIDFSTVPMPETVFQTSNDYPPIVYAHQKEFRATLALLRLIDLTTGVRVNIQTELQRKVPGLIKRELDRYINWAAQDGDYNHLRIVPNIMVEVVDPELGEEGITDHIQNRMRDLGRLQREFLRDDRHPDFWDVVKPSILKSPWIKLEPDEMLVTPISLIKAAPKKKGNEAEDVFDEHSNTVSGFDGAKIKVEPGTKRKRPLLSPTNTDADESSEDEESRPLKKRRANETQERHDFSESNTPGLNIDTTKQQRPVSRILETFNSWKSMLSASPTIPKTPIKLTYRRRPPVVYGIFIIGSSALLLTVDSSKGDNAYVSFHVQAKFQETHQSVWNALTLAMAVCMARDELRERREDFESLPVEVESDPDA